MATIDIYLSMCPFSTTVNHPHISGCIKKLQNQKMLEMYRMAISLSKIIQLERENGRIVESAIQPERDIQYILETVVKRD